MNHPLAFIAHTTCYKSDMESMHIIPQSSGARHDRLKPYLKFQN